MTDEELRRLFDDAIRDVQANPEAAMKPNPAETGEFFENPNTGQMTSRELLTNAKQGDMTRGRAAMIGAADGATFRWGDEIAGGGDRFRTENIRAEQDAARAAYPVSSTVAEIGGALPAAVASAPLAMGRTALGVAGRGAALGAAEGGMIGAGGAEPGERIEGGAQGAVIGGLVGMAAPAVVAGGRMAKNAIVDPIMGAAGVGNQGRANRMIASYLARTEAATGRTGDDIASAVTQAAREGQPEFRAMDAMGRTGQRAASTIARRGDEVGDELASMLEQRQLDQGSRVANALDEAFDMGGRTAKQVQDTLVEGRGARAGIEYDAAIGNAAPVDVRGVLGAIDDRIGPFEGSGVEMDDIGKRLAAFKRRLTASQASLGPGETARDLSDFESVLQVKKEIGNILGDGKAADDLKIALRPLFEELDGALEDASPLYRQANDNFRTASGPIDAINTGQDLARPAVRGADAADTFNAMDGSAQAGARVGYGDKLMQRIEGQSAPTSNRAKMVMGPTRERAKAEAIATDPALLSRRMQRENDMWEVQNRALGGSRTADNLADDAAENEAAGLTIARSLANFQPGDAMAAAGRMAWDGVRGRNEEVRKIIAKALMSDDPAKALAPALRDESTRQVTSRIVEALGRNSALRLQ